MDDLVDYLKLLRYHIQFCHQLGFKPLVRGYFETPNANPMEQFYYFTSLVWWLLKLNNRAFEMPGQFDDPNVTATNIVNELKMLEIPVDFAPTKLRQGHGDVVVGMITALAKKALEQQHFEFKKPVFKNDGYQEEVEVDRDAEVTVDRIDEVIDETEEENDENELFLDHLPMLGKEGESKPQMTIKAKIDQATWKLEVERVAPLLKVHIPNDNKDWRIRLEQMQLHEGAINSYMSDTNNQLTKLHKDIERILEKITTREKYINSQFENQTEEYRTTQEQLSAIKQRYAVASGNVTELTNELARVSEELDHVKALMDEIGSGMTDSKPLVNIKQGLAKLKNEIKEMDLRIGVIQHTLLHARLKNKSIPPEFSRFNPIQVFSIQLY